MYPANKRKVRYILATTVATATRDSCVQALMALDNSLPAVRGRRSSALESVKGFRLLF